MVYVVEVIPNRPPNNECSFSSMFKYCSDLYTPRFRAERLGDRDLDGVLQIVNFCTGGE